MSCFRITIYELLTISWLDEYIGANCGNDDRSSGTCSVCEFVDSGDAKTTTAADTAINDEVYMIVRRRQRHPKFGS